MDQDEERLDILKRLRSGAISPRKAKRALQANERRRKRKARTTNDKQVGAHGE